MILQIEKFLEEHTVEKDTVNTRVDIAEGVVKIVQCEGFTQVYFQNNTMESYTRLEKDEFNLYTYSKGWLLSNEGNIIKRIF